MLEPIISTRLYKQVALRIIALIESGAYVQGQRLPAERELVRQLGVSRNSLHQALVALEAEGVVEIRSREGIFVSRDPSAKTGEMLIPPSMAGTLEEIFSARDLVETEVAARAASFASPSQLDVLIELLCNMIASPACSQQGAEFDLQFHQMLAEASGNRVYVRTVAHLWESTQIMLAGRHEEASADDWTCALAEHREILNAIRNRDGVAARNAMHHHLLQALARCKGGKKPA